LKDIAQGFNQTIVQGVALGRAAQAHHSDSTLHLQGNAMGCGAIKNGRVQVSHAKFPSKVLTRWSVDCSKKVIFNNVIVRLFGDFFS
jgi:hypothetical protein